MSQPTVKKAYLLELEMLRAFGIIAVVIIHATSSAVVASDPSSAYYLTYVSLNTLSKFAVPFFILISGLSLFYNYYDRPLTAESVRAFYRKRITKILLPFLIFSLIYYAVFIYSRHGFTSIEQFASYFLTWDFVVKLIIGKTYTHLYFIFIILQCYMLFPLIWFVLRKWPSLVNWQIAGGLAVQWLYMLNAEDWGIKYVTSGFFAYSLYFCIGAYIGINYSRLQQARALFLGSGIGTILFRFALICLWAMSGALSVYLFLLEDQEITVIVNVWVLEIIEEIYISSACLLLIQLANRIKSFRLEFLRNTLVYLGVASFGIYLLHPLFLKYYRLMEVSESSSIYGAWIAGGFLLALFGSWIIVACAAKVKGHWILFGPIPLKRPKG